MRSLDTGYKGLPRGWESWHTEWGTVVGDRIRRLRREREWTLHDLAERVERPDRGPRGYSPGFFSKLERGFSSAPLYAYLAIADVLDVQPGILLGPDEAFRAVSAEERVLLDFLAAAGIRPGEALAKLKI